LARAVHRGILVAAAVYVGSVMYAWAWRVGGCRENQCRVVSLPRMAKRGPMPKPQPEPSRNKVVAVAVVASVTHSNCFGKKGPKHHFCPLYGMVCWLCYE